MKIFAFLFSLLFVHSISGQSKLPIRKSKFDEEKVMDSISKFPEVVFYSKELMKTSKRHLKIWSSDTLEFNKIEHVIYHVGEDNGDFLVSKFKFAKPINSNEIMYFDIFKNKPVSLLKLRKRRK